MKKLILKSNSKLIFLYSSALLLICILVGISSLDFYSGEQYGYWYLNKIFLNEFFFPEISRSPIYVIYLSLFNWLDTPYNYYAEAITTNFLLSLSLFYLFKSEYNKFYIFLIISLSIGFFFNLIPYPQALALSFLNFAIILRRKNSLFVYLFSYLLIICAVYSRITYITVFVLFIFFDLFNLILDFKKKAQFIHKKIFIILFVVLFLFSTNYLFKSNISESKFNNGYFQSLEWKPSKSNSNIDIAFQVNFNFLYYEKNKNEIDNDKKDFFYTNNVAFDGAETIVDSIISNPKFVFWGILKNTSHLAPIILNKFNSRTYFTSCSGIGHSCYTNYFYIGSLLILFLLFNYYFFFKKKYENDFDIKIYALVNYALILSTVLAMPKIRYMTPFIFFLIPFNFYLINLIPKKIKIKYLKMFISIFIIFSFSYFNFTSTYLKDYISINNFYNKKNYLKNYINNLNSLNSNLQKCKSIFASFPTFILSNNYNIEENKVFSPADIPPFGNYKSKDHLQIYKNIEIDCLLLDRAMKISSGSNRGTGSDYDLRRKNYINPFLLSNKIYVKEEFDYGQLGKLYIYSIE